MFYSHDIRFFLFDLEIITKFPLQNSNQMKLLFTSILYVLCTALLFGQNSAVEFNGVDDHFVIEKKDAFNVKASGYTIEAWIFANTWTSEIWRGTILGNDGHGDGPLRGYAFRCGNNGSLSFVMSVDNQWNEIATTPIMNTKQWHHVAVTVGNGNMTLYIDGQAINTTPYEGITIVPNTRDDVFIASSAGFGGRFFDGLIDEIRVWDVARTPAEIADNTTTELTGSEAGLVAYFPMNEGSGTQAVNVVDASCIANGVGITDNSWLDGYTLPEFDLSVKGITGIDRLNMKSRPVKVAVDIQNTGLASMNNYTLTLSSNGTMLAEETVDQAIPAGELSTYIFQTPVLLTEGTDDIELDIELSHPDDANILNNSTATNRKKSSFI